MPRDDQFVTPDQSKPTVTVTLIGEQIAVLKDALYEALHGIEATDEQIAAFLALRKDLNRQLHEQRTVSQEDV